MFSVSLGIAALSPQTVELVGAAAMGAPAGMSHYRMELDGGGGSVRDPQPSAEVAERERVCVKRVCVLEGCAGGCRCALRGEFVTMARLDPLICSWEQLFGEKPWLSCLLCLW